jgi:hypothetical protein
LTDPLQKDRITAWENEHCLDVTFEENKELSLRNLQEFKEITKYF